MENCPPGDDAQPTEQANGKAMTGHDRGTEMLAIIAPSRQKSDLPIFRKSDRLSKSSLGSTTTKRIPHRFLPRVYRSLILIAFECDHE